MGTVLITGANRGIGLELSRQLTERGETVIALCRKASAELEALGMVFTADMKIRFTANDANPQSINEAGVDGFQVFTINCDDGIPGDVDGDGVVDATDFLALLAAWGPCP